MKNIIIRFIAKRTLKYIKYLQKNRIECLQDEEGNIISIKEVPKEVIKAWQNEPVEITIDGKKGIFYKKKTYILKGE